VSAPNFSHPSYSSDHRGDHQPEPSSSIKEEDHDELDYSNKPGPPYTLPKLKKPRRKYQGKKKYRPRGKYYGKRRPYHKNKQSRPRYHEDRDEEESHNDKGREHSDGSDHVTVSASMSYDPQSRQPHIPPSYNESGGSDSSSASHKKEVHPSPQYEPYMNPFIRSGFNNQNPQKKLTQESNHGFTKVSTSGQKMPDFDSFGDFKPFMF